MFQAKEEGMQDTGLNILTVPYLGPAKLSNVEVKEVGSVPNCLQFTFTLSGDDMEGNSVKGINHQHVEWAPNDNDDAETKQKKVDRIAYIAGRIVPEEKVLGIQATTWVDYCKAVINLLEDHAYSSRNLVIKVLGNVWQGKARVKFPGYNSFVTTEDGKPLTWSANELKQNQEYLSALGAKPTAATDDAVALDDVEQAGF